MAGKGHKKKLGLQNLAQGMKGLGMNQIKIPKVNAEPDENIPVY